MGVFTSYDRGSGLVDCMIPGFQRLVVGSCTLTFCSGTSGGNALVGLFFTIISFRSNSLSRISGDVTLLFCTNVVLSFLLCRSSAGDGVW